MMGRICHRSLRQNFLLREQKSCKSQCKVKLGDLEYVINHQYKSLQLEANVAQIAIQSEAMMDRMCLRRNFLLWSKRHVNRNTQSEAGRPSKCQASVHVIATWSTKIM